MQLRSPRYLDFVRRFIDAATTHSLLEALARMPRGLVEEIAPRASRLEPRDQRDAA